jgi:hypothetical protein
VYAADYPILAKAQKPGGVTVLSAVSAGDVPNKPTYTAGTIQMLDAEAGTMKADAKAEEEGPAEEAVVRTQEDAEEENMEEIEDDDGDGDDGPARRTVKRTTTRTTTRRR